MKSDTTQSSSPPKIVSVVSNPAYSPWIGLFLRLFLAWFLPWALDDGRLIPGVSYTDIDFFVFTDAARYIQQGGSPYDRHTYRYTPFLAGFLAYFDSQEIARYLFCIADALCGWIILSLRRGKRNDDHSKETWQVNLQDSLWWLYNPLAINICTRGSAESLMVLLPILGTFWLATKNVQATMMQVFLTGICHGLSVHSKLYPIIYSLSYMAFFATPPRAFDDVSNKKTQKFPWTHPLRLLKLAKLWIQRLLQPLSLAFLVSFLATFAFLTWLAFHSYGEVALQEGLLYHFGRVDHRHNYSMYWYWIYLERAQRESIGAVAASTLSLETMGKIMLLPQAFLLAYSSIGMAPTDLGLALFVQTYLFVSHNKVITAQYFTWYLCLLPLCTDRIQFRCRRVVSALILLGLSILGWLASAYLLEMQGMAVHKIVWGASVAYFFANVNVMGAVLNSVRLQQETRQEAKNDRIQKAKKQS